MKVSSSISSTIAGEHREDSSTTALLHSDFVFLSKKGTPISDTLRVALGASRRHDTILRVYDKLTCDENFRHHNFAEATYADQQGKPRRCVMMTKAGFLLLALSLTGKKATSFKTCFIQHFEQLETKLAGQQPPPPIPLPSFASREVQVQCTKQAARKLLHSAAGKNGLIQHHRGVMQALVGITPSEYVKAAVASGLRVASISGRELLRRLDPPKAATAAFLDDQLQRGKSLHQLTIAGVPQALTDAFAAMLRAGITPSELLRA